MDRLSPRPGLSTEWVSGQTGPHKETRVSRNQIEIYASWPPFFTNLCNMDKVSLYGNFSVEFVFLRFSDVFCLGIHQLSLNRVFSLHRLY